MRVIVSPVIVAGMIVMRVLAVGMMAVVLVFVMVMIHAAHHTPLGYTPETPSVTRNPPPA
jgi:hypothetical protein